MCLETSAGNFNHCTGVCESSNVIFKFSVSVPECVPVISGT